MDSITLEMSLKPFQKTEEAYVKKICRKVFLQWEPLVRSVKTVCVLLWTADGSELFDYGKDENEAFEWAYFIGGANNKEEKHEYDPQKEGLHSRGYRYMEHPPVMTYKILKFIVKTLKETGKEILGDKEIKVGTTVDTGPEFARSDFKYHRHPELCTGGAMGKCSMLCAYEKMHADHFRYAGFPEGVPEGLPFGTFFGRQAQHFMVDMGFDYIWFSNGLGFGKEVWSDQGAIYDGKRFHCENMDKIQQAVTEFWTLFRRECDFPIETRGTNQSLGIDNATDGVPLKTIYDTVTNLLPPPNSPWAALNGNYGLELMGYMSRIAHVPNDQYLFRYYIHDPWWVNSPWYDRYNGEPHDIYLPLAVSRIDENGKIKNPTHLNLLSVDNSYGELPDSCANEPIPHLLKGIKESPDSPSSFVWVYPFHEYSECREETLAREMYEEDKLMEEAINEGVPICTVTATDSFVLHDKKIYSSSVIITPTPFENSEFERSISEYAQNGGRVVFYGKKRRCSASFAREYSLVNTVDELKKAISDFGFEFAFEGSEISPKITVHKHNNSYIFSVFTPVTTVESTFRLPFGAPVLDCYDATIKSGKATYHFPKAMRRECRVFVEQESGTVGVSERAPVSAQNRRLIEIRGLENATVRIMGEEYCKESVKTYSRRYDGFTAPQDEVTGEIEKIGNDTFYKIEHYTGTLFATMPQKRTFV